jgi:hypothetical protein
MQGGIPMSTVIFETESGIFSFDLGNVLNSLARYSTEHEVREAADLLEILESTLGDVRKVPSENGFFGYIVLELLGKSKGSVFCKACKKEYEAINLHAFPIGFGDNPLIADRRRKRRVFRGLFTAKPKMIGMSGGKGFNCPKGHELISMITWIS